jgi:hypothetical protein
MIHERMRIRTIAFPNVPSTVRVQLRRWAMGQNDSNVGTREVYDASVDSNVLAPTCSVCIFSRSVLVKEVREAATGVHSDAAVRW